MEIRTQAFPSISTGVYGYPIKDATYIALSETRRFMDSANGSKVYAKYCNKKYYGCSCSIVVSLIA